ncbi:MAG: hypothetical protein R3C03_18975 [Pirellulaceae bacterium]
MKWILSLSAAAILAFVAGTWANLQEPETAAKEQVKATISPESANPVELFEHAEAHGSTRTTTNLASTSWPDYEPSPITPPRHRSPVLTLASLTICDVVWKHSVTF